MYFWRIERLKAELAAAPTTDRQILPYYIATSVSTCLTFVLAPKDPNRWDAIGTLASVASAILGILWIYRQNGGSAGREFVQRCIAIGWVVGVRVVAIAFLGFMLLMIFVEEVRSTEESTGWTALFGVLISVAFYQRVGVHVRHVALGLPSKPIPPPEPPRADQIGVEY